MRYRFQMEEAWITFFFFFQAEDGIRDLTVTGVQTCALPIFGEGDAGATRGQPSEQRRLLLLMTAPFDQKQEDQQRAQRSAPHVQVTVAAPKIGRASCRERV